MSVLVYIFKLLIVIFALRAITGFRFPWEKCPCCGKRLDKNHKRTKDIIITREDLNRQTDNILKSWEKSDIEFDKFMLKRKKKGLIDV